MLYRRWLIAVFFTCCAVSFGHGGASAQITVESQKFIQTMGDETVAILQDKSASKQQRDERFRALLEKGFEMPAIGRFVIGRYWRIATPDQQKRYQEVFVEYVLATYSARLSNFNGQQFKISQSRPDQEGAMVNSEIQPNPGSKGIRMDWRVRQTPKGLKIVDVLVEGVSMAITQRDEFSAVIASRNGNIDAFIEELKGRINSGKAGSEMRNKPK